MYHLFHSLSQRPKIIINTVIMILVTPYSFVVLITINRSLLCWLLACLSITVNVANSRIHSNDTSNHSPFPHDRCVGKTSRHSTVINLNLSDGYAMWRFQRLPFLNPYTANYAVVLLYFLCVIYDIWRCCLTLEVLRSIPARSTTIYLFLCGLHTFSCARAS